MNELPLETFRNHMIETLDINNDMFNHISSALLQNGAIIAGGSVLRAYIDDYIPSTNEFAISPKCMATFDFDIYVNLENAKNLVEALRTSPEFDFDNKCSYVAPPYDDSFFKKNNILGRFMLLYKKYNRILQIYDTRSFDILVVKNNKPLIDVVDSFDLSFCKIWFDGRVVRAVDVEGVLNKTGTLEKEYVNSYLNGNYFTISRVQRYKKRGFKILMNMDTTEFLVESKKKGVISGEDWVVSNILKYLVFDKKLRDLFPYIPLFNLYDFYKFTKINLNSYVLSDLTSSLINNGIQERDISKLYALAFYKSSYVYENEYRQYIRQVLGIENIIEYVEEFLPELERVAEEYIAPEEYTDEDEDEVEVEEEEEEENEDFDFEEALDIDEKNFTFDTCRDLILDDNVNIVEHLNETDTFLFINGNPAEIGASILCFDKNTIRQFLENKNDNWFYECDGPFLTEIDPVTGEEIVTNDRSMRSIVNFPYIKIFLNEEGLTGFVPLIQIRKLLSSNHKVYYIYPMIENGTQKMISHTVSWQNAYGPPQNRNNISANHCQAGSNILIYTLKVCRDPERCVKSIISQPAETSDERDER